MIHFAGFKGRTMKKKYNLRGQTSKPEKLREALCKIFDTQTPRKKILTKPADMIPFFFPTSVASFSTVSASFDTVSASFGTVSASFDTASSSFGTVC